MTMLRNHTWPVLFLLLLLVALNRQPPAGFRRRLLGGIAFGMVAVRILPGDGGSGLIGDPRDAFALLTFLALGVFCLTRWLRLPDPF